MLNRKIEIENEVMENEVTENETKMKLMFKQNIGMSFDIAVVNTARK